MDKHTYNIAYWLTYGEMPPGWRPMPPRKLQKLLAEIAPTQSIKPKTPPKEELHDQ